MTERKHFQEFTEEEIAAKRIKVQKKNTIKSNVSTSNQFQAYLAQLNEQIDFWEYESAKLDEFLGKFWFAVRQSKQNSNGTDKKYTVQSLHSLRYGLKHVLKDKEYRYNIITLDYFTKSQQLFEDACRELKAEGLGSIKHYPEITPSDNFNSYFHQFPLSHF